MMARAQTCVRAAMQCDLDPDITDIVLGFCAHASEARLLCKAFRDKWDQLHPGVLVEPPSIRPFLLLRPMYDDGEDEDSEDGGSADEADEEIDLKSFEQDVASAFYFTKAQSAVIARQFPFRSRRRQGDTLGIRRPETMMAVHLARTKLLLDHNLEKARVVNPRPNRAETLASPDWGRAPHDPHHVSLCTRPLCVPP